MEKGKVYLIPTTLGDTNPTDTIPLRVKEMVNRMDEFFVEDEKWARKYLKKLAIERPQNELVLHEMNKHSDNTSIPTILEACLKGKNIGVISEAGCPAIADPGSEVVKQAHRKGIEIVPLVGPSSILLSLMASGFNGQQFAFNGYLPIDKSDRVKKIQFLEKLVNSHQQTQIFIETPFRNNQLLEELIKTLNGETNLCVAINLTLENEKILRMKVSEWRKKPLDIHKQLAVFLIG